MSYRINNILGEYEATMQSSWQQIKALFIPDAGQHIPSFYIVEKKWICKNNNKDILWH
ncbi:MAG TPA: hypothetical protein VIP70_01385 [Nitrososphaeraceae archaeon]